MKRNYIEVRYTLIAQHASEETCKKYNQPPGTIEILDAAGDRLAWAQSMAHAEKQAPGLIAGDWMQDHCVIENKGN